MSCCITYHTHKCNAVVSRDACIVLFPFLLVFLSFFLNPSDFFADPSQKRTYIFDFYFVIIIVRIIFIAAVIGRHSRNGCHSLQWCAVYNNNITRRPVVVVVGRTTRDGHQSSLIDCHATAWSTRQQTCIAYRHLPQDSHITQL